MKTRKLINMSVKKEYNLQVGQERTVVGNEVWWHDMQLRHHSQYNSNTGDGNIGTNQWSGRESILCCVRWYTESPYMKWRFGLLILYHYCFVRIIIAEFQELCNFLEPNFIKQFTKFRHKNEYFSTRLMSFSQYILILNLQVNKQRFIDTI